MDNKNLQITNHDFLIYKDSNNDVKVSVMLINNDIWLTQNLIAELFGVGRSTITEHINNILNSGELDENNTVGKTDLDNSKKPVKIYNLDMIIAVGYRVNSKKATNFRIWATKILKEYMIKGVVMDDERLKYNETYQEKIEWPVRRSLSKTNYRIYTDSIKEKLILTLTDKQKVFVYANEADVINVALFGMTAKEWRENNPKLEGNIRDYTDILHLVVLSNLEVLNASMIENNIGQKDRLEKLNETAKRQITILASDNNIIGITKLDDQKLIGGTNE